jgi:hypothetical protein
MTIVPWGAYAKHVTQADRSLLASISGVCGYYLKQPALYCNIFIGFLWTFAKYKTYSCDTVLFVCLFMCVVFVCVHNMVYLEARGQLLGVSFFFPSTIWVLRIKLKLTGLAQILLLPWANSPAYNVVFWLLETPPHPTLLDQGKTKLFVY